MIKGCITLEHTTVDGMPFYEVRDDDGGLLAALHFRRDESIDHFLRELIGCINYTLAKTCRNVTARYEGKPMVSAKLEDVIYRRD